ncbi:MAG TPA: RNA 3'-terminal phosphate cyclase [Bryobacteraceae bacterium]|nr:RNA 3'-terminal phosphate cyclase [Bryobacteraceae bacterium]
MALREIDGSFGEGGGQILRTSLALSLVTRTPFRIVNIRVKRAKPGLRRQHLTAVRAAARIGNAQIEGDALGSTTLTFRPGEITGGTYTFEVGTAGSTTLVFQTVLPALLLCGQPSAVTFRGGTHNHGGPPWEFLDSVFLPVIARLGAKVNIRLARHGFVPAGGGEWSAEILPSQLHPIQLHERGERRHVMVRAIVANLPASIAERELDVVRAALHWPHTAFKGETVQSDGPGNIVMITGKFSHVSELAAGFGQRGVPAEEVAATAVRCWSLYEESGAPVGEHLADQLLLPFALAGGGSFTTITPTLHTKTNIDTISRFVPVQFDIVPGRNSTWVISA